MKIELIDTPTTGTGGKDCKLLLLSYGVLPDRLGFWVTYYREKDNTFWSLRCEHMVAYKVTSEKFLRIGYLINLPVEGFFFEISDSPWIDEFKRVIYKFFKDFKHYVLQFSNETIEIIAQKIIFEKLDMSEKDITHVKYFNYMKDI